MRGNFQDSGLGKPPFKFMGIFQLPSKSLQEHNPEAYNNALKDMPKLDIGGCGTCSHCGTGIQTCYIIKSSDGLTSSVGCDCINKLAKSNLAGAFSEVERAVKKHKTDMARKKRNAKYSALKEQVLVLLNDAELSKKLESMPHKNSYYTSQGKNLKDYYLFCINNVSQLETILNELKTLNEVK